MSERRRARIYNTREHRKASDRRKDDHDFGPCKHGLSSPVPGLLTPRVNPGLITDNLIYRLTQAGISEPAILRHSDIYEKALTDLGTCLNNPCLPPDIRNGAFAELDTLTQALIDLFGNRIRLKMTQPGDAVEFSGYQNSGPDLNRAVIYQKLATSFSPAAGRPTYSSCQILVQAIAEYFPNRGVMSESDAKIRCGLGSPGFIGRNRWNISIDSGLHTPGDKRNKWRIVRPLSQAIFGFQTFEYFGHGIDTDYTYHYSDPTTEQETPVEARSNFEIFNLALNTVFRNLDRRNS